jgi:hypothetical protein
MVDALIWTSFLSVCDSVPAISDLYSIGSQYSSGTEQQWMGDVHFFYLAPALEYLHGVHGGNAAISFLFHMVQILKSRININNEPL